MESNFELAGTELNGKFAWKYLGEYNKNISVSIPNGAGELLVHGSNSSGDYGWTSTEVIIPWPTQTKQYFSAQTSDTTLKAFIASDGESIVVDASSTSAKQRFYYR